MDNHGPAKACQVTKGFTAVCYVAGCEPGFPLRATFAEAGDDRQRHLTQARAEEEAIALGWVPVGCLAGGGQVSVAARGIPPPSTTVHPVHLASVLLEHYPALTMDWAAGRLTLGEFAEAIRKEPPLTVSDENVHLALGSPPSVWMVRGQGGCDGDPVVVRHTPAAAQAWIDAQPEDERSWYRVEEWATTDD
jgi:hypothetical protein